MPDLHCCRGGGEGIPALYSKLGQMQDPAAEEEVDPTHESVALWQ
jgi:hypothetical protein